MKLYCRDQECQVLGDLAQGAGTVALPHPVEDKTGQQEGVNHFEKQMQFPVFRQFCDFSSEQAILCRRKWILEYFLFQSGNNQKEKKQ